MTAYALYRAAGLDPVVAIADDGRLLATLGAVTLGWELRPIEAPEAGQGPDAAIRVAYGADGWTCSGATYDEPATYRDPVAAACALIASLYKAHTLEDRIGLFLHAAGVRIGGGLVLLTGHYRAGKSVVTAACAAAGHQVFSDDIIPLDPGGRVARAPGLAIRLRLPLPATLAPATRAFIEAHRIASSQRYAYVRPPRERLALRDEAAPIRAVVSIRRVAGAPARLLPLGPGDALRETILRNFAREAPAGRILDAFDGLIGEVPCAALSYDRAEDAAALLGGAFAGARPAIPEPDERDGAAAPRAPTTRRARARPLPDGAVVRRAAGVNARERGGQAFLTDAGELVIFNLNATGTAVWRMIKRPTAFGRLAATFAAAFPDRDPDGLADDLSRLIRDLAANGLVRVDEE